MIRHRLAPLGLAIMLFFLSILATGPVTQWLAGLDIKPGVIATASENTIPILFTGTILQQAAIKSGEIPMYGSSEFSHGGVYNPMKLFTGHPTGWTPYLVGHAGSTDLIQALYACAQDLKGRKIVLSLSAQWFSAHGIAQTTFAGNFSALQAYKMLANPNLSVQTKTDFAHRLLQFNEVRRSYPVLAKMLEYYGQPGIQSHLIEAAYWPAGQMELAALEIQDLRKTLNVIKHLPPQQIARNAAPTASRKLPPWSRLMRKATADVKARETNNPYGINNQFFKQKLTNYKKQHDSAVKGHFYPSPEYNDLHLLMQVLKDEGADPIFLIQPVNGRWYDYTGFPKSQRQKYYQQVRTMAAKYGFAVADFSGHEYDPYFMDDPSHPSEKGWVEFDEALDHFVHQKS